jgi:hypothetical protein
VFGDATLVLVLVRAIEEVLEVELVLEVVGVVLEDVE